MFRRSARSVLFLSLLVTIPSVSLVSTSSAGTASSSEGVPALPAVATADEVAQAGADGERMLQDLAPMLGDSFAGAWLDEKTGSIHVGFAGTGAVAAARRDARLAALTSDPRVILVERKFSSSDLDQAIERVAQRLNARLAAGLSREGATSWPFTGWVNTQDNVVEVEIDKDHSNRRSEVETDLRSDVAAGIVRVRYDASVDQEADSCISRVACRPVRGGVEIQIVICTTGFVMKGTGANRTRFMTTADHCSPDTPLTAFHGNGRIGTEVWSRDELDYDFKVINIDNRNLAQPTNVIYRDGNIATRITTKISTPNSALENNPVCLEGAVIGSLCGKVTSYNHLWLGRAGFAETNYNGCNGDSGGPVVAKVTNRAYGIHSGSTGGCGSSGSSYFTWISRAEAESGYSVLMTPAPDTLGMNQGFNEQTAIIPDQQITSLDGRFTAVFQEDGNFVVYWNGVGPLWSSASCGQTGFGPGLVGAHLQDDGNFVIYGLSGAVWATSWGQTEPGCQSIQQTVFGAGVAPYVHLRMQNDGNLVMYKPGYGAVWATNTGGH